MRALFGLPGVCQTPLNRGEAYPVRAWLSSWNCIHTHITACTHESTCSTEGSTAMQGAALWARLWQRMTTLTSRGCHEHGLQTALVMPVVMN